MSSVRQSIDRALELYLELIQSQAALSLEFEGSIHEYYGGPPPVASPRETLMAARRHLEWFVLERHSPALTSRPAEGLLEVWSERVEALAARGEEVPGEEESLALFDSFAGIFEISSVEPGQGAWLGDLAGLGQYPILDEGAGVAFLVGDLVLGRLFPIGAGAFHLSVAAGIHRDERLKLALKQDIERTREARSAGKIMRVSQRDLETMFWLNGRGSAAPESAADPRPEARAFLRSSGRDAPRIEQIFDVLAAAPIEPDRLLLGSGDVLGGILTELAFETDLDLERARHELLAVWTWLSLRATRAAAPSGASEAAKATARVTRETAPDDPAVESHDDSALESEEARTALEALRAFDARRASGSDLDQLFRLLEQELELEPDEEDEEQEPLRAGADDDAPTDASDQPRDEFAAQCVLAQILDEFLWELGLTESEDRVRSFEVLRCLARFGKDLPALEDLAGKDLLRFTCFWLPEQRALESGAAASTLLEALEAFCGWCEESHGVELRRDFSETLTKLRGSLPRIVEANRALGRAALDPSDSGELYRIQRCSESCVLLKTLEGEEREVVLPVHLRPWLQAGDALRGRVQIDDSLSVFCCYPPESRGLSGA